MSQNYNAIHDDNAVPTAIFAQQGATTFVAPGQIDQTTGRILVDASGASVAAALQTDIFVATANQTVFTSSLTMAAIIYVSVQGVIQTPSNVDPSGHYTATSSTVTFSIGQVVGSIVLLCYATS